MEGRKEEAFEAAESGGGGRLGGLEMEGFGGQVVVGCVVGFSGPRWKEKNDVVFGQRAGK